MDSTARSRASSRRIPVIVAGLGLALLSACTGTKPTASPGDPSPSRAAVPDPALVALGELLDDEGTLPLDAAQRVFATTVAPIEGVAPLTLAGEAHHLAGAALRALVAPQAKLPEAVATAVAKAIEMAPDETEVEIPAGAARARAGGGDEGPADVPDPEELAETVSHVVAGLAELSGHELRLPVRARVVPDRRIRDLGVTWGDLRSDGSTSACRIMLAERAFAGDGRSAMSTIAHEVWHCFQLDVNARAFESGPLWMIEGQAEWAGEAYVGGSSSSASGWDTWLLTPENALTRRSYDAIGLYAVAESSGAETWENLLPMLGKAAVAAVETLFGGPAAQAVRAQSQALVRFPEMGRQWESYGPGITDARTETWLRVSGDEPSEVSARAGRLAVFPVRLDIGVSEVVRIAVQGGTAGAVALPGAGTVALEPGGSVHFCMAPGGCFCPDGTELEAPRASSGTGAASIGAVNGGRLSVVATPLTIEEACEPPALVGRWTTDVSNVMAVLARGYGEMPHCTGPYVVDFREDGSWSAGYQATCRFSDITGSGSASFTGTYTATRTTFTVADVAGRGVMTIRGVTMPLPGVDGFRAALGGTADYVIVGDTLTYSFNAPDGNRFTISLTRTG
ncbi:MAG TPA: hypothetical protein VF174_13205 [Micromonosporaceae bacterium]